MRFNAQVYTKKSPTQVQAIAKKKVTIALMLFSLLSVGSLLVATQLHAEEANLYAKNYQAQNANQVKSQDPNPDTKLYVSNHKEDDNVSMLEDGYDMMGSSSFKGKEDVTADGALQYGKEIKADKVLVYRKYSSAKTASGKIELYREAAKHGGEIDPKDLVDEPTEYSYYASYWAKLPMPLLGVHVIKLVQAASESNEKRVEEPGLKIIAVIKESPAAKASIVRGDSILKIGDVVLAKADDLFAAVKRYQGQTVEVVLHRGDEEIKTKVALNAH
jgi:C-terminal processing protease CtpA/Prc